MAEVNSNKGFNDSEFPDAFRVVEETNSKLLTKKDVSTVYGRPIQVGETTVIPAAEILTVLGYGVGGGYSYTKENEDTNEKPAFGGGGGGGGRSFARPVAAIIISHDGVRVEPIIDVTKIALAALTTVGFMLAFMSGILNPKKALKGFNGE